MSLNGPHHHHHHRHGGRRYGSWNPWSPVVYADPYPVFIEETPRDEIYRGYRIHQAAANVFVVFKPGVGGSDTALGTFVNRAEAHTFIDGHAARGLKGLDDFAEKVPFIGGAGIGSKILVTMGLAYVIYHLSKKGVI